MAPPPDPIFYGDGSAQRWRDAFGAAFLAGLLWATLGLCAFAVLAPDRLRVDARQSALVFVAASGGLGLLTWLYERVFRWWAEVPVLGRLMRLADVLLVGMVYRVVMEVARGAYVRLPSPVQWGAQAAGTTAVLATLVTAGATATGRPIDFPALASGSVDDERAAPMAGEAVARLSCGESRRIEAPLEGGGTEVSCQRAVEKREERSRRGKPRGKRKPAVTKIQQRHGPALEFNAVGALTASGGYLAGKRHGVWTEYHSNGRKAQEGGYANGELHGTFRVWDTSGRLQVEMEYVKGEAQAAPPGDAVGGDR